MGVRPHGCRAAAGACGSATALVGALGNSARLGKSARLLTTARPAPPPQLGTHLRAKKKREEMANILRKTKK